MSEYIQNFIIFAWRREWKFMESKNILRAYSIKEVSRLINIPTGTIRQWEKDLDGLLVIPRTSQGARYYTEDEINILKKVKEMREQNVSKGMIRSLLEKHLHEQGSEPAYDTFEITPEPSNVLAVTTPSNEVTLGNVEAFYAAMDSFKQDMLTEFRNSLTLSKNELIDEVKNEVSNGTLITVKEISKSIQRSNDKRKVEVQEITNAISSASEQTSETFEALSDDIRKSSEATYEKLSVRINATAKINKKENQRVLDKVNHTLQGAQNEIRDVADAIDAQQEFLIQSINELKQSQEDIEKREEIFQSMIAGYREVAAAKSKKKKWWQVWS